MAITHVGKAIAKGAIRTALTRTTAASTSGASIFMGAKGGLVADVVQLPASAARWSKPAEEYIPKVFEGAAVPMHHGLHGHNLAVRKAVKYRKDGIIPYTSAEDREWFMWQIEEGEKTMKEADLAFKKLIPTEKDIICYRGRSENPLPSCQAQNVDFDIIGKAKVGDVIVPDTAYSYAAFHKSLANNWGGIGARCSYIEPGESNRLMMMTLRIPKGARVSRNLEHGGEIVMPRGAEYRVISKETKENGDIDVVLEYILPKL